MLKKLFIFLFAITCNTQTITKELLGTISIFPTDKIIVRQLKEPAVQYFVLKHTINYETLSNPENDIIVSVKIILPDEVITCYLPLNIFLNRNRFREPNDIICICKGNDQFHLLLDDSFQLIEDYYNVFIDPKGCCIIQ